MRSRGDRQDTVPVWGPQDFFMSPLDASEDQGCHLTPPVELFWGGGVNIIMEKGMATHSNLFLPGESDGRRSLFGYSLWGRKESDATEQLTQIPSTFIKV